MSTPPTSKRAAREASQAAMLGAATQMLLATPVPDVLADLRPVEVARRSVPPRTTGAFYNIWPTQEEFRRDLLTHVVEQLQAQGDRDTRDLIEGYLDGPDDDLDEIVRRAANLNFASLRDEPRMRIQTALWVQARQDPEIRAALRDRYREVTASYVTLYEAVLGRAGLRLREPFTMQLASVLIQALADGLRLRWAVDPDAVREDVGAPPGVTAAEDAEWSLFASVVRSLLVTLTEPDPDASPHPRSPLG